MKKLLTLKAAKAMPVALLLLTFTTSRAQNFSRTRLALNGGWGYRLAKTNPDVDDRYKDLIKGMRSGAQFGGDFMYYFSENMGVGLKYNHFSTSTEKQLDTVRISKINTGTDFYGAMFGGRIYNKKYTGAFIINISLGYLHYTENGLIQEGPYRATGGTLGAAWDLGYDFKITPVIAVGAQITGFSGALRSMTREDNNGISTRTLQDGQAESMTRIGITAGIRLTL